MNLIFYSHGICKSGGAEKILVNLINFLSSNKINIELITFDSKDSKSFYNLNANIKWHKITTNNKFLKVLSVYNILKSKKFNYFVCFNLLDTKSIFFASLLSRTQMIICERNGPSMYYIKYNFYQRFKIYFILFFANKIIVQFNDYIKKYPYILRNKISSIPNPIIINNTNQYKIIKNTYNILYLGRLDIFQKQIDLIIDSFYEIHLKNPKWNLLLVGSGNDKEILIEKVNDYKINDKVTFIPETNNIEKYLLKSDLFIYPSKWEGFPNSLAEALSSGIPSIGIKSSEGVSNLISDKNGWLIKSKSDLTKTLKYAITNHNERLLKSNNAKKLIEDYNPDKIYHMWYDYFKSL